MLNPFHEVDWNPGVPARRRFAACLVAGFPVIGAAVLVALRLRGGAWDFGTALAVGGGGAALGLLLWAAPGIARPFYVAWHAAGCCAGWLVGNTLLASVYLLMIAPLGLALRALGRSPIRRGFDRGAATYWREACPPDGPERYYRQY